MGRILALVMLCALLLAPTALADGKMFSDLTPHIEIPEQSALIGFDGQEELLVIETRFEGEGKDFAWVVPLPHAPTAIEKSSRGLFPTLRMVFRPYIVQRVARNAPSVLFLLAFCATVWLALFFRRSALSCLLLLALWTAMAFAPAVGVHPGLGTKEAAADHVTVHSRRRVGSYEVAALSATKADALLEWLKSNGYVVPEGVRPAVQRYSEKGWVFVAAKLAEGLTGRERDVTHPLAFRFPTSSAVYPLALTGVGNGSLRLDLYVFANRRATAQPLHCERAGETAMGPDLWRMTARYTTSLPVVHAELRRLVSPYAFGTKLTGTLSPQQMRQDMRLRWTERRPVREKRYLPRVVSHILLMPGSVVTVALTLLWLALFFWRHRKHTRPSRVPRALLPCWLLAAGTVLCAYGTSRQAAVADDLFWVLYAGAVLCVVACITALVRVRGLLAERTCVALYLLGIAAFPLLAVDAFGIDDPVYRGTLAVLALLFVAMGHARVSQAVPARTPGLRRLNLVALATVVAAFGVITLIQSAHVLPNIDPAEDNIAHNWYRLERLKGALVDKAERHGVDLPGLSAEELSSFAASITSRTSAPDYRGRQWAYPREEDSPGNFVIEQRKEGWALLMHGSWGGVSEEWNSASARDMVRRKRGASAP